MNSSNNAIHLLQEHIIDQIKAGEVIERPSTLIKEILENSIDAGSKNINIEISQNGLDLISIEDDGHGISPKDLPLAFCRHATSKIDKFEDLYSLHSYGFRGEALASIASISKVSCDTNSKQGSGLFKIEGGETLLHEVNETPNSTTGTKLYIRDLFFNTPARMKFIQSATTEKNKIKKILNAFLLTNPHVNFTIKWDDLDKDFFDSVDAENFEKRINDALFKSKKSSFHHNENSYDGVNVEVFLTFESSRGNAHKQNYIFINDRYVQDPQLHRIILNSAQILWPDGESGSYIVKIQVPSDEIDVNVHPNKTVIKFFKPGKVFSLISSSIKQIEQKYVLARKIPKSDETQSEMLNNTNTPNDFTYKEFDFSSSEQTQNYFDRLHGLKTTENTSVFQLIKRFSRVCLVEHSEEIYILKLSELFHFDLTQILENLDPNDVVPLLVSRPIQVPDDFKKQNLDFFSNLGFDCDLINKNSILLRSFPKSFQNYPYILILETLLNKNDLGKENIVNFDFSKDGLSYFDDHYIAELVLKLNLSQLLSHKILIPITEKDLSKLYENK